MRLGQLTSGDPGWTPATAKLLAARPAEDLARDARVLAKVLGAVHEAADAFTRMAGADFGAIDAVRRAGRLCMPAGLLGRSAVTGRHPYVAVPDDRAHLLKNAYYLCFDTSLQAAAALDALAVRAQAPSRMLGLFRSVLSGGPGAPAPEKGFELCAGLFADQAGLFTRPLHAPGRSTTRDHAYIISACTRENLSIEETARRFSVSPYSAGAVLSAAGIEAGDRHASAGHERAASPEPSSLSPEPEEEGPLYHRLRECGIDDPGLLERAAIIDRATADVMLGASENAARRNTAARLAAMDNSAGVRRVVSRASCDGEKHTASRSERVSRPAQPGRTHRV